MFGLLCILASCGGGGSGSSSTSGGTSSNSSSSQPQPNFTFAVQGTTVTVQQGGGDGESGITARAVFSGTGTVQVSFQNLPVGVGTTPAAPFTLSSGNGNGQVDVDFYASASTPLGTSTVTVTATEGAITESASFSLTVAPKAAFNLSLSTSNLSVVPGSLANVVMTVTSTSGPLPSGVSFQFSNAPSNGGVTFRESLTGVTTQTAITSTMIVDANATAQPVQNFPVVVTASNANQSSVALLMLSVNSGYAPITAPTRSFFKRTNQDVTGAVYDQARKLVFATVLALDEVLVFSSTTGNLQATIPVDRPMGIDESADGKTVYVGSWGAQIAVIDPDSLQVIRLVPGPAPANASSSHIYYSPVFLVTLANGNVLITSQLDGTTASYLYIWDP
jgi:hypothetical protein